MKFICEFCYLPFNPNPKATNQKFCKRRKCKKKRRSAWQKKKELQTETIEKTRHILKKIGKKKILTTGKDIEQIIQNIPKETEIFKKDEMKRGKDV